MNQPVSEASRPDLSIVIPCYNEEENAAAICAAPCSSAYGERTSSIGPLTPSPNAAAMRFSHSGVYQARAEASLSHR